MRRTMFWKADLLGNVYNMNDNYKKNNKKDKISS